MDLKHQRTMEDLGIWEHLPPTIVKDCEPHGILCVKYTKNNIPESYLVSNSTHHAYGPCPADWIERLTKEVLIPMNIKELYVQSRIETLQKLSKLDIVVKKAPKVARKYCSNCQRYNCLFSRTKLIKQLVYHGQCFK